MTPPACYMTYLPASDQSVRPTAVWVCGYPYRTLRLDGPSRDCGDCPVWRERELARLKAAAARAQSEVGELERLVLR
jgi:hypothetical protein